MIPANIIEDLKFRNSIEDVISSYVTLTRSGANMKGLCPFHSEKTPSFTVYTGNSSFYCFGCGAGGDVVSFIMRIENLDYRSALDLLASRCGITLPDDDARTNDGVGRARVLEMNLCAARFFRETLFSNEGTPGQEYFAKRQLSLATVKRFGLGYAPNTYDSLKKHLRSHGFTDEEMVAGYLCQRSRKNENNIYDCFRGRVMFPIIDVAGNIVAFGGRVLDDSQPKYLNSADTPAFKKSRNLFALNYARNHAKEFLILCEGYMDVIALHAAGFENAVATLGTAITPEQARIMKKFTDKVYISYDSDEAGQKAADKALRLLDEVGIDARVITIPGAKDPDEFIKTYGAVKFSEVLSGSLTGFEHKLSKTLSKYNIKNADERSKAAKELCKAVAEVYSKVEREIYAQSIADKLNIDVNSVKGEINSNIKRNLKKQSKERHSEIVRKTSGIGDRIDLSRAQNLYSTSVEDKILGMLMFGAEYRKLDRDSKLLSEEMFFSDLNRRLYKKIASMTEDFDFVYLNEDFSPGEVSEAARMVRERSAITNNNEIFKELCSKLKREFENRTADESGEDITAYIARRRQENK